MRVLLSTLFLFVLAAGVEANESVQRLQQLVDYVGVDYRDAVRGGRVVNATEYEEMLDFTHTLMALSAELPDSGRLGEIRGLLEELQSLVREKADAEGVAGIAGALRQLLIQAYGLAVVPAKVPDLERGRNLFARQCAGCHGAEGKGNGPLAATLDPVPTDFTDFERYRARTLYGLYSTITRGVEGTAMRGFAALPQDDRWSLAFYVGQLAPTAVHGAAAMTQGSDQARLSLEELTTLTPGEVEAVQGVEGARWMAWLRSHPESLFSTESSASPLTFAREKLRASLAAYGRGEGKQAHELAVTAYLEGFELVEGNLDAVDPELRRQIEGAMTAYRGMLKKGVPQAQVREEANRLEGFLDIAGQKLGNTRLSPATAFVSALVILLREGLEAILVLAALGAFLIKTGRRDGLRYLHLGTGAAVALGLLTWYLSTNVIAIGGAGRELTEGLAALLAALILFYVGFWLHSKTGAAQWKSFIQGSVKKALSKGTLWGLSGLAFIAVYREIFETVLFYQALWIQTGEAGQGMIFTGFLVAVGLLLALGWMILRYSTRLPLRQFFSVTGIFMFILAVVFAGKGIAALQEAGRLPVHMIDFPSIEILGIYPNLQGLGVQLLLVIMAALLLWKGSKGHADRNVRGSRV